MSKNVAKEWHKELESSAREMTVRLGPLFQELCQWAINNRLEHVLQVSYHILGLNSRIMGIPNLVKEISFPESREILETWTDSSLTTDFLRFTDAFNQSGRICEDHQPLSHEGNAKRTKSKFPDVSKRTFLLALIALPLDSPQDPEITKLRRSLRLWLILHAADRLLRFKCPADSDISTAARYLTIDSSDDRWDLIDSILQQVQKRLKNKKSNFQRFNNALKNSAKHAYESRTGKGAEYSRFLNSVQNIANGLCNSINSDTRIEILHLESHWQPGPTSQEYFESAETTYQIIPNLDDEEREEATDFLLADIDPTDTQAQQALLSGSVLIQTAESAHYLPWSWDRILPPEIKALDQWISNSLSSTELEECLGGAYVWLSMTLSRSLRLLDRVRVGESNSQEWSISSDFGKLIRAAPRRHSGWKPDEANRRYVAPIQESLTLNTPEWIRSILREAAAQISVEPTSLGELWSHNVNVSSERWFNRQMTGHLERITSAKLGNRTAQAIFDETGDYRLARLLTSHPQSALPGDCSYATWDISEIEKGLSLTFNEAESLPANLNVIGSRLVPFEEVLTAEISKAQKQLLDSINDGLIHYHNTLAQFVVMALYAATGARPLRDPFDSPEQFNLELPCVFINDKDDAGLHSGRLVPLPDQIVTLLGFYQRHLDSLSHHVIHYRATLGNDLRSLAKGQPANMPFFFLLDSGLQWRSMAEAGLLGEPLFNWPLPTNLFRHRYAQYLALAGVDSEVIAGWMGHAERGVATYHDYSPRCWATDASDYKNAINDAYDSLGFCLPPSNTLAPPLTYSPSSDSTYREPKSFGARARAQQRKRRLQSAIRAAKDDIAIFLGDQAIDDLDDTGLTELSKQMLLRPNQLPHPQAGVRYRLLAKLVARSSIAPSRKFRKRVLSLDQERSLLSSKVIRSLEYMPLLQAWAQETRLSAQKSSLSKSKALCVGSALLAIEKRISYARLLLDVSNGDNFRVVQSGKEFYFEYNESLASNDFRAPVQRHEISYKTASLLAHGLECSQDIAPPSPASIKEFESLLLYYQEDQGHTSPPKNEAFFTWLAKTIDQCNLVQLPGIVAAGLSKRLPPTSPSWTDQLRLVQDRRVQRPKDTVTSSSIDLPVEALNRPRRPESDKIALQKNAKRFVNSVRMILKGYGRSKEIDTAKHIEKWCADNRSTVSTSLMLLGFWLAATIRRGKAPAARKFKPYAHNTLTTYWGAMSSVFEQLTYQVDLIALDEESVTELCEQMLDYKRQSSANTSYFGERLSSFFRWARQFGVESPDWGELDIDEAGRTVSPGLIGEDEYLGTLSHISAHSELNSDHRLLMGFVLLCAYRFGLRSREAIGLLRKDVCQTSETTWLLVRNNAHRSLKSTASRRAIPLVFKLHPQEERLIEEVIARHQSLCGYETSRPLLCETDDNMRTQLTSREHQLSTSLIVAIRAITGNSDLVLHHCRHTFFNRVAAALLGLQTPLAQALTCGVDIDRLRHWILGSDTTCSRRIGMALARLMGHRSPRTGLHNYFHLLTEWSDLLTPVSNQKVRKILTVPNVSSWQCLPTRDFPDLTAVLTYPPPTLQQLFQVLRLVSLGQSYARAGTALNLEPGWIVTLESVFKKANDLQSYKSDEQKAVWLDGKYCPNALLESISPDSWQRLIHQASEIDTGGGVDCSMKNVVDLAELPQLISKRRHLVFDEVKHSNLIRQVFELFKVPDDQYQAFARFDDETMIESLINSGFSVKSEIYFAPDPKNKNRLVQKKVSLHGFPIYSRRRTKYSHGEIILHRSAHGIIHNSYDLAVTLLATGSFISMSAQSRTTDMAPIRQLEC